MDSFLTTLAAEYTLEVKIPAHDPNNNEDEQHSISTVQVYLTINFDSCVSIIPMDFSNESHPIIRNSSTDSISVKLTHPQFSFEDEYFSTGLAMLLSGYGVDDSLLDLYTERIITAGRELIDRECEKAKRRVIPLVVEIGKVEYVMEDEERWAEWESMEEFERRNGGRVRASEEAVKSLKRVVVEVGEEEMNCVVCLEEVEVGKMGMVMPCEHVFHEDCILTWLKESHLCPLCRYQLPTATDES